MCGIFFFSNTQASTFEGVIEKVTVRESDNLVWVDIIGTRSNSIPACGQSHNYMMIKNENSATGKRILALLLMAHATNAKVVIDGSNNCTRWVDGEDIEKVEVKKQ